MRGRPLGLALLLLGCGGAGPGVPSSGSEAASPVEPSAAGSGSAGSPSDPAVASSSAVDAASPSAAADPAARFRAEAMTTLDEVVDREAGNPANAWALAHGILARGPEFRATDGRRAIDVLVADFLVAERVQGWKGLQPHFPRERSGGLPVEPHTDLILKTLFEAGLKLDDPLTSALGAPTLSRLLIAAQIRFSTVPEGKATAAFAAPDDVAWSITAFCQASADGGATSWRAMNGKAQTLQAVTLAQLEMLEQESWFLRTAKEKGEAVQKRRQGIFGFTCGGAHLHQAVAACAAVGLPADSNVVERLQKQTELYLYRVPLETRLVEDAIAQAPKLAPVLFNQDIKFLGHLLESMGKAERDGLFAPTEQERLLLDDAEARLLAHVVQMKQLGVYRPERMADWLANTETRQFYLDLVGDACHAVKGLRLQADLRARRLSPPPPSPAAPTTPPTP